LLGHLVAEQRDAAAEQHRNDRHGEVVDQVAGQKGANHRAAVDVQPLRAGQRQLLEQGRRLPREELLTVHGRRLAVGEHHAALARVRPLRKRERGLVRVAADHERVDRGEELGKPVVFAFSLDDRQEVEGAVRAGDEAIEAGGDEDRTTRALHATSLTSNRLDLLHQQLQHLAGGPRQHVVGVPWVG